jgi:hypothetical protein
MAVDKPAAVVDRAMAAVVDKVMAVAAVAMAMAAGDTSKPGPLNKDR